MLNCIVICRCMDKKPYGNIMDDAFYDNFSCKSVFDDLKGGGIMKSVSKHISPISTIIGNHGMDAVLDSDYNCISTISRSISAASIPKISTFWTEPDEPGKFLAPLSGN